MHQEPVEYVRVIESFAHGQEFVWQQISDFGGIARWIEGVTACEVSGHGVGAVRTVTLKGRQVRERLSELDPVRRMLGYEIMPPHGMPARDVATTMEVLPAGPESSTLIWRSRAVFDGTGDVLQGYIEPFYRASLRNLHLLLDSERRARN